MLQRIQTLYLLLVALLMLSMAFLPLATLTNESSTYVFEAIGLHSLAQEPAISFATLPVLIIIVLTVLIPLITIFLFKKRQIQMRLCNFNAVLIVAFYAVFFFYWWMMSGDLGVSTSFNISLVMPAVALIVNYMAFRRITQDEILVRSVDRIR